MTTSLTIYGFGLRGNSANESIGKHRFRTKKHQKVNKSSQKTMVYLFGTQSLAVTIRVLSDEEVDRKKTLQIIFKELRIGFFNGLILGVLSFITVFLFLLIYQKPIMVDASTFVIKDGALVAFIIALSLFISLTIATVVGTSVPILLKKIHIDPAVASGPFITTLNDIFAVVIYYGLASLLFSLI